MHARQFSKKMNRHKTKNIIFACDFNAAANWGAYELLMKGKTGKITVPKAFPNTLLDKEFTLDEDVAALGTYLKSAYPLDDRGCHSATKIRLAGDQPDKVGVADQHTIDFI